MHQEAEDSYDDQSKDGHRCGYSGHGEGGQLHHSHPEDAEPDAANGRYCEGPEEAVVVEGGDIAWGRVDGVGRDVKVGQGGSWN